MTRSAGLPPELVFDILSLAIRNSRQSALAICLVCSWARNLALPILYGTVTLRSREQLEQLHRTICTTTSKGSETSRSRLSRLVRTAASGLTLKRRKPLRKPEAELVKNLWILEDTVREALTMESVMMNLLEAFPSLRHLLLPNTLIATFARPFATTHITQLTVTTPGGLHGCYSYHGLAFLSQITHLAILPVAQRWTIPYMAFPALTHLAVMFDQDSGPPGAPSPPEIPDATEVHTFALHFMQPCDSLAMLVLCLQQPRVGRAGLSPLALKDLVRRVNAVDGRVHLLPSFVRPETEDGYLSVWGHFCNVNGGIWEVAKNTVRVANENGIRVS